MFGKLFRLIFAAGLAGSTISLVFISFKGSLTQQVSQPANQSAGQPLRQLVKQPAIQENRQPVWGVDPSIETQILSATVRIRLYASPAGLIESDIGSGNDNYVMSAGLGTLAVWQGQAVIITHNQWGLLHKAELARFYNAQGELQMELSGVDFRTLVRYQDKGTLILAAPLPLVAAHAAGLAKISDSYTASPGDLVIMVHQAKNGSDRLAVSVAEVDANTGYASSPVIKLGRPDGLSILPGDSGGGIWFHKQLVGNMCGLGIEKAGKVGYAATFPMESRP